MTPYYAIGAWTKANLVSLGVFGLVFWAWGWPLWPQMCAILKVYFVLYKLSGCAAFQLKYFRSYDREIEFSPKNHPPPIWRGRVGDGRYFPHSYRSEIFWGFLNIYFQMPCAPGKQSDDVNFVGPTLIHTDGWKISPFYRTSSPIVATALPPPMKTEEKGNRWLFDAFGLLI